MIKTTKPALNSEWLIGDETVVVVDLTPQTKYRKGKVTARWIGGPRHGMVAYVLITDLKPVNPEGAH